MFLNNIKLFCKLGNVTLGVFSVTFMKCHHKSVDMQRNQGKVGIDRDLSFWAITYAP